MNAQPTGLVISRRVLDRGLLSAHEHEAHDEAGDGHQDVSQRQLVVRALQAVPAVVTVEHRGLLQPALVSKQKAAFRGINPYNPDVAHHIIKQFSKSLLRTHPMLECEANDAVPWRTFGPNSPSTQQTYIHAWQCSLGVFSYIEDNELWISTNHMGMKGLTLAGLICLRSLSFITCAALNKPQSYYIYIYIFYWDSFLSITAVAMQFLLLSGEKVRCNYETLTTI